MESKANHVSSSGFSPIPKGATVQDLIEKYSETVKKTSGRTKAATLEMLKRQIGKVQLTNLNALVLRDFIDRRSDDGAGGVTIAADLSYLSAVLKWARHARQLDINDCQPAPDFGEKTCGATALGDTTHTIRKWPEHLA